jgi:hypothetical protein
MRIIAFIFLAAFLASACQTSEPQELEVIDIAPNEILNHTSDRQERYSLIKWSDTCEQTWQQEQERFENTGNGLRQFQVDEQKYIVFVSCSTGPNFFSEQLYQIGFLSGSPVIQQLGLKIVYLDDNENLIDYIQYETVGVLHFEEATKTLTYLFKGGGMSACRHYYVYKYENSRFTLQEARQRKCEDDLTLMPEEWERIY